MFRRAFVLLALVGILSVLLALWLGDEVLIALGRIVRHLKLIGQKLVPPRNATREDPGRGSERQVVKRHLSSLEPGNLAGAKRYPVGLAHFQRL